MHGSHDHTHEHQHDHGPGSHAVSGHRGGGHAGHHHGPADGRFGAAFAIGAALNLGLVAAQVAFGIAAHSAALLADAVHNFGDVLALLLAWAAAWIGARVPSARRTYGFGRASILAALINAVVLLLGVGAIGIEALRRLRHPGAVAGLDVMAVAAAGIVVNGFTAWLFARGRGDLNVRAAFQHMASDALVSLAVVVAGGLVLATGWSIVDPLASLAIVAVVVAGTWSTLVDAVDMAMDAVPAGVPAQDVAAYLRALPGVEEVHDLHIWALSTSHTALTAHLVRASGQAEGCEATAASACEGLRERFGIAHATLQFETEATALTCRLRAPQTV
jgi:cobalt-zinc-cadmium efflux system protein